MQPENHWHLKKELTIGQIASTAILAAMLIAGWVDVQSQLVIFEEHLADPAHAEHRIDALETEVARIQVLDASLIRRFDDLQRDIINRLDRIEDRLNAHTADP